jgi:hypothetical protein
MPVLSETLIRARRTGRRAVWSVMVVSIRRSYQQMGSKQKGRPLLSRCENYCARLCGVKNRLKMLIYNS